MSNDSPWKTLSSKIVYESKWMRFYEDQIIHPDDTKGMYSYLNAIPGIIVIAEKDGKLLMINEYKYPIKQWIWNFITGGYHEGEDHLIRAKQELIEETGYNAKNWKYLGKFYFAPSIETTYNHCYLATGFDQEEGKEELGEGDEAIREMKWFTTDEILKMINSGVIVSGLVLGILMPVSYTHLDVYKRQQLERR